MIDIPISEFRQKCLSLLDHLPPEGLLITRHGHPVAKVLPIQAASCADLIGTIPALTNPDDDLFSTGESWEAHAES